ncbi:MAG: glycosyltransferase family 2 protein [Candidatus Saccharibacteria bacterium]|nr:glycosyltransferase family 2 protein [Candidatus Saccharibacteria bacterium]
MKHFEIPYVHERGKRYRLLEMLPGILTWSVLALPFVLSLINPTITVFFVLAYLLMWLAKAIGLNVRSIQGYKALKRHQILPWTQMLQDLRGGSVDQPDKQIPAWHYENVKRIQERPNPIDPNEIVHAIIIATYNESRDVLEPTIQSVLASDYDVSQVILVLAYEERGGSEVEEQAESLMREYKKYFRHAFAVKHPKDIPGEVIGKGGNITFAGRELEKYIRQEKLDPLNVIVTTLDADNRPHPKYLSTLSYVYAVTPDPLYISFQPIPMFTNNIWDAPAPMRIIATGNTFWNVVLSLRPHMLRNFSSHAQSLQTLIDTDYWSVRTIVEDGHQFWRTYFRYDGNHEVYPIYLPVYQDAVMAKTYVKTLKAQFIQLRRWAWGASDIAYVLEMGFFRKNKIPRWNLIQKFLRLLEGHLSWATAPLILAFAAFIPLLLNPDNFAANQLPMITRQIHTIAMVGIFIAMLLSLKILPPKPERYKRHRSIFMVAQWVLLPLTTIVYHSMAALYSQTRLMFGWYIGKFDVTEKTTIRDDKQKIT